MSFDLFLRPAAPADGTGSPPHVPAGDGPEAPADPPRALTPAALRDWLNSRLYWTVSPAAVPGAAVDVPSAARYAHPDTGAGFTIDVAPDRPADAVGADDPGADPTVAAVGVPLLAPTFFARAAAGELAALCDAFRVTVDDPQAGTAGPFDPDAFLETWRKTAGLAARHVAARPGPAPPSLPSGVLDGVHDWNAARDKWRRRIRPGGPLVPRVQLRRARTGCGTDAVRTWCAWVDSGPIVLPPCDDVLLVRDAVRGGGVLGKLRRAAAGLVRKGPAEPSLCLVPRSRVAEAPGFGPAPERYPPGSRQLAEPTPATRAWFTAPPADAAPPDALPPAAVIERDRLEPDRASRREGRDAGGS